MLGVIQCFFLKKIIYLFTTSYITLRQYIAIIFTKSIQYVQLIVSMCDTIPTRANNGVINLYHYLAKWSKTLNSKYLASAIQQLFSNLWFLKSNYNTERWWHKRTLKIIGWYIMFWGFPSGSALKNLPAMQEMQVQSLGPEDPLEESMASHSSILA